MAEVAQEAHQEFWQPPSAIMSEVVEMQPAAPTMAEVCPSCGTEFLVGSGFCHSCGRRRPEVLSPHAQEDAAFIAGMWERGVTRVRSAILGMGRMLGSFKAPSWFRRLDFHEVQGRVGLSTGSLIAFMAGLACVAGALVVGLLTARTLAEWQAIQYYRAEWLLGATASFVAGILLKKS